MKKSREIYELREWDFTRRKKLDQKRKREWDLVFVVG